MGSAHLAAARFCANDIQTLSSPMAAVCPGIPGAHRYNRMHKGVWDCGVAACVTQEQLCNFRCSIWHNYTFLLIRTPRVYSLGDHATWHFLRLAPHHTCIFECIKEYGHPVCVSRCVTGALTKKRCFPCIFSSLTWIDVSGTYGPNVVKSGKIGAHVPHTTHIDCPDRRGPHPRSQE